MGDAPRATAPTWMDATLPSVGHRRGAVPLARSALPTWTFFGLIVLAVATAGLLAISVWGPDKTPRNRTQFATHPATPPAPVESAPSPEAVASAEPSSVEPEAVAEAPAAPTPPKKAKKPLHRTVGKKAR